MTIFKQSEEELIRIFRCPICLRFYYNNPAKIMITCCVIHSPGDCCHYSDIEIREEDVKQVERFLKEASLANG